MSTPGRTPSRAVSAARTRPAAQPSFSTSSGVIGGSPTRPRTPSVPKYWRVIGIQSSGSRSFHRRMAERRSRARPHATPSARRPSPARRARGRSRRRAPPRQAPPRGLPAAARPTPRPVISPSVDLRDRPATTGKPVAASAACERNSARLCASVLPKPKPGSIAMRSRAMPASSQARARATRKARTSATTSPYEGAACIVRGSPCMCIRHTPVPFPAHGLASRRERSRRRCR